MTLETGEKAKLSSITSSNDRLCKIILEYLGQVGIKNESNLTITIYT
jgi:hypothetical protein